MTPQAGGPGHNYRTRHGISTKHPIRDQQRHLGDVCPFSWRQTEGLMRT
jgi:hypothetical protein